MKWDDIELYKLHSVSYSCDIGLKYFSDYIEELVSECNLKLNPDFQRGCVWTEQQQVDYIEYVLRGGMSGKTFYLNNPKLGNRIVDGYDDFVCVDGLQRITSILRFLNDEIPAFGVFYSDFDGIPPTYAIFHICINSLMTKYEVFQWYIEMNSGGTVHAEHELDRVRDLLRTC